MTTATQEKAKLLAAALNRLNKLEKIQAFDAADPTSRPTPAQQSIIDAIIKENLTVFAILGGNQSGKSALSMRILAWLLDETFPDFDRRKRWGDEPLQILLLARTLKQAEESLWRKLEPLLTGKYRVQRIGGVISKVTNTENKNTLLFFSHDNVNEARARIQSFTAQVAVIDELPGKFSLIEETIRRIQAKNGMLLLPFTPKVPAPEIKKFVENLKPPFGRFFKLKALDNPAYDEDAKARILASTETMSESMKRTVLEGDWMLGEETVYHFDYDTMVESPEGYTPAWPHVESSDPALSSKFGFLLAAQNPNTGVWYVIKDEYITDTPIDRIVDVIKEKTAGVNLVRRIMDPHEVWYYQSAVAKGLKYTSPYDKSGRKGELIRNLQTALGSRVKLAPWCKNIIDELQSASWHPTKAGHIQNSSALHLNDCAQYLVDCLPKDTVYSKPMTWYEELRAADKERRRREKRAKSGPFKVRNRRRR